MKLSTVYILFIIIAIVSTAYSEGKTIINWSYPHYDQNNLLDWEAKGETAVIREDEIIVTLIELTYYLQPVSNTDSVGPGKKVIVHIKANSGTLNEKQNTVLLHDRIIINKVSEPPDEFDETMQTDLLYINLADRTFSTESLITLNRSDITIKSKGCKGGLDFANVAFLGNVETIIQGCNSKSICLGDIFSPKPNIDDEEVNKTPSVITITSEGPMSIEKINGNPAKRISQQISFRGKVAFTSYSRPPNLPPRQTNLRAENLDILLERRENPVTKRNNFYLARASATVNVRIDDTFHRAACSALTADETTGIITLKGDEKSLAAITRPLKSNNGHSQAKTDSYINIAAQTLKVQAEKDNLLLLGRKEITFSNGSIYTSGPISSSDSISPTEIAPPANQTPDLSTKIQITADNDGLVSLRENQIYLENNVRITQMAKTITASTQTELTSEIKCSKLTIGWNSTKNLLEKMRAENDVLISTTDGGQAWCEILEWTPILSQINLKSPRKVIIFDKNSKIDGDEIVITTNPQTAGYIGSWSKIEIKNKSNGSIQISPKEKEEPK
ncbi:MAG: LPS export ABC transporter periplasmic protein LptC [Planctomycetes bacterium]|nr:LPS export ABC transporter periplasmic protein LptC [Planctomycetota bacterium]